MDLQITTKRINRIDHLNLHFNYRRISSQQTLQSYFNLIIFHQFKSLKKKKRLYIILCKLRKS